MSAHKTLHIDRVEAGISSGLCMNAAAAAAAVLSLAVGSINGREFEAEQALCEQLELGGGSFNNACGFATGMYLQAESSNGSASAAEGPWMANTS